MYYIEEVYDEKFEGKVWNITLTRADTLFIEFPLFDDDDEPYTPVEGDSLRFAMKKKYKDEEPLILIDIPTNTCLLEIRPEHTKPLPFGDYYYDVEFTDSMDHVSTILKGTFTVDKEVH